MSFFSRVSSLSSNTAKTRERSDERSPPSPVSTESEYPEGGLAAWSTVLGAFIGQACGYGYLSAFGVYQDYYTQHYLPNASSSAISWIGSITTFLVTGIGPICGPLYDRGYFYHVYVGGAILQSFSLFMLSLAQPGQYYQIFLAQGLGSGIAQGLMYVPCFAVLSQHFNRRRTIAMSIVSSGVPLGGVVHTMMLNKLLHGPMGFKTGVRMSAAFVSILLLVSCFLVRTRYGPTPSSSVNFWKATKKCIVEVPSLLAILGFMLYQIAYLYPFFYFQIDSIQHGLSTSFSFYSLVIVSAGSFIGRFTAGFGARYAGVIDMTILSTIGCAILIIGMIWLGSVASVVVLGILYGLFSGINIAMMAPVMAFLTLDPAEMGIRMGVSFAITGFGGLIGPPICGALLTNQYIWWAPALFCSTIAFVGGLLFVVVRVILFRKQKKKLNEDGRKDEVVS